MPDTDFPAERTAVVTFAPRTRGKRVYTFDDLTGKVFGDWTVLHRVEDGARGNARWACRCSCGIERPVHSSGLTAGKSTGCGRAHLAGLRFGRLVVLRSAGVRPDGKVWWLCRCDCGVEKEITGHSIGGSKRPTLSCGCWKIERIRETKTKHGESLSTRHRMWCSARHRAKIKGLDFDIALADIVIPSHCPIFGIPLEVVGDKQHAGSPSLDRKDPRKGYTKENIHVISFRANSIKNDALPAELRLVANYMESINVSVPL